MKKKKLSLYKKSLIIFSGCLFVLMCIFLCYVYSSLVFYDKYEIDNYMNKIVTDLKSNLNNENLSVYNFLTNTSNVYEQNVNAGKAYKDYIKDKKITYKESEEKNTYDIYADDSLLLTVKLDDSKKTTRLAILTVTEWEVEDVTNYTEEGLYSYDIYVPSDYKVTINSIDIQESDLAEDKQLEGFEDAYKFVSLVKEKHYKVEKLISVPEIKIFDSNNNEVTPTIEGTTYKVSNAKEYSSKEEAKELLGDFDPLKVAETWSLLLTNDTSFNNIKTYLITDSRLYIQAHEWVTGRDKTFTANHVITNPVFTNEYEGNFVFYSNDAFKVEISLTKNLLLTNTNQKKTVPMHETLYFVKVDGTFKLVNMISI